MKSIFLSMLIAWSAFTSAQTLPEHALTLQTPPTDLYTLPSKSNNPGTDVASVSVVKTNNEIAEAAYRERGERNCARYKQQQIFGTVFTAIGGGFLGAGIAMTAVGNRAINNDISYNQYGYQNPLPYHDLALRDAGITCILVGLAGLGLGIPNLVIGSVRYHKYCGGVYDRGRERDGSYMELHTNGTNLALNF